MPLAEPPTITVTATPPTDAGLAAKAGAYVRGVLPTPLHGQYARWADPICVRVAGVGDAVTARVASRIGAVAAQAAIPLAKPGCKPTANGSAALMFAGSAGSAPLASSLPIGAYAVMTDNHSSSSAANW